MSPESRRVPGEPVSDFTSESLRALGGKIGRPILPEVALKLR
jgi:hypothetical protein